MWQATITEKKQKSKVGAAEAACFLQCLPAKAQQGGTWTAQRQMCCSCSSCPCPAKDGQLAQKAKQQLGTGLAKGSVAIQVLVQGLTLRQV